ncbi:MAG: Glucans biosynthesis protein, partial [Planctomycetota bacterium]
MTQRRSDLDALRSFAMLLGVVLHASLSFVKFPWMFHDTQRSDPLFLVWVVVHGFRLPLFFLLSGYFTMLVYDRRGLKNLLHQRFQRIFVPLVVSALVIGAVDGAIARFAQQALQPEPAVAEIRSSDLDAVRKRMAVAGSSLQRDTFWGRSLLTWATMNGDPAIVEAILDASGNPSEQAHSI